MVLSPRSTRPGPRAERQPAVADAVVWHDLECGSYSADLPLWRELAGAAPPDDPGPVLEIGAGTGRVALALAREGVRVTALERDPELLDALAARAGELPVEPVLGDARELALDRRDHGLCIVPMQTVQLFGAVDRRRFLRRAHQHVRAGGLLACAIAAALEPFDCSAGELGPAPDHTRIGDRLYSSRPTRVQVEEQTIVIERERRIYTPPEPRAQRAQEVVTIARLTALALEREGTAVGFTPEPARTIAPTDEYVGAVVVMLRA